MEAGVGNSVNSNGAHHHRRLAGDNPAGPTQQLAQCPTECAAAICIITHTALHQQLKDYGKFQEWKVIEMILIDTLMNSRHTTNVISMNKFAKIISHG